MLGDVMENKDSYSPKEVAQIARAYRLVKGGFDNSVSLEVIKKYKETVPEKVRKIIDNLNNLESLVRQKALEK